MNFAQDPTPQDETPVENTDTSGDSSDQTFVEEGGGKDPKQQKQIMMILGLLVVAAGVIWWMYFKPGPAAADAATTGGTDTVAAFLANGEEHMHLMKQTLQNTDKVVQRFRQYPTQTQVPLTLLRTNPFRAELPKTEAAHEDESTAAAKRRRAEERQAAAAAVTSLRVQSIVFGGRQPACMINNHMVRVGQVVDGFTVDEVNQNSVIVRQGLYRFELLMEK